MEKIVRLDPQGRVYLPEAIRKLFVGRTLRAVASQQEVVLSSLEDDPVETLARLGKGKMNGKSIAQLKKEARGELKRHAGKHIRR